MSKKPLTLQQNQHLEPSLSNGNNTEGKKSDSNTEELHSPGCSPTKIPKATSEHRKLNASIESMCLG